MSDFIIQGPGIFSGWESPPATRIHYEFDTLTKISNSVTYDFDTQTTIDKCQLSLSKCEIEAIAKLVWHHSINNNEAKDLLQNTHNEAKKARQFQSNAAIISQDGQYVEIYDDDGITILHRFNVSDDRLSRYPI